MSGYSFGSPTTPVARKAHRCEWCWQGIAVGEKHYKYVGVWEGDFQDWRMHLDCLEAWKREDAANDSRGEICDEKHGRGKCCGDESEDKEAGNG